MHFSWFLVNFHCRAIINRINSLDERTLTGRLHPTPRSRLIHPASGDEPNVPDSNP